MTLSGRPFEAAADGLGTFAGRVVYDTANLVSDIGSGAVDVVTHPEKLGTVIGGAIGGVAIGNAAAGSLRFVRQMSALSDSASAAAEWKPPGWTEDWEHGISSRSNTGAPGGTSWWDPNGGEWHLHVDESHQPHWDYNAWRHATDQWHNIDLDGQFSFKYGNYKR